MISDVKIFRLTFFYLKYEFMSEIFIVIIKIQQKFIML